MNAKKVDKYIIKKFLGTLIFSLLLVVMIIAAIDTSHKIDEFLESDLSTWILLKYVVYNLVYVTTMILPIIVLVSVIFFTSRLSENNEILSIFNSGSSYLRVVRPYLLASILVGLFSFVLNHYITPITGKLN